MKRVIKIVGLILGGLLLIGIYFFFRLADLRTDVPVIPGQRAKAVRLIEEMGVAHRISAWDSIPAYRVKYVDDFFGTIGEASNPFEDPRVEFHLWYSPKGSDGELEILTGAEKGKKWGMRAGQAYEQMVTEEWKEVDHREVKFWIPTYQYFIEFPRRIQEATVIEYVGSRQINGIAVEGVLATWNTAEPQRDIDQYIIWLDRDTKRIVKVEYTVREFYAFVKGAAYFQNYQEFYGLLLPTEMPVESNLVKEGLLHKMGILDVQRFPWKGLDI